MEKLRSLTVQRKKNVDWHTDVAVTGDGFPNHESLINELPDQLWRTQQWTNKTTHKEACCCQEIGDLGWDKSSTIPDTAGVFWAKQVKPTMSYGGQMTWNVSIPARLGKSAPQQTGGSSTDMRAKLSLLTLYLAIQCHVLSIIESTSSQHKELKVNGRENVAK